jgi:hypothetical protein
MLNTMPSYVSTYTRGMETQILGKLDQALAWTRYVRIVEREAVAGSGVHFSDQIFGQMADGGPAKKRPAKEYRSCSWLDHGLYVNRHGLASGCARIKNAEAFGFGAVAGTGLEAIVARRDRMAERIRAGEVAEACKGCFIAESIAVRMTNLIERCLVPGGGSVPSSRVAIGAVPRDARTERSLVSAFAGGGSVREVIARMSATSGLDAGEGRRRLLPLIGELVREGALVFAQ